MIVKQFTDENYIPMTDIANLDESVVQEIVSYRRNYLEMVKINDLDFVNIIETPSLIKKRFKKNVELKGRINISAEDNDFILEIAKRIADGKEVEGIVVSNKKHLLEKYNENKHDLTIITDYLINNLDSIVVDATSGELDESYPELTQADSIFIKKYNNVKSSYTIAHYQELNKSSYETGRRALEKMVNLDFYKKEKVGKKFVYKPTQKLIQIMKGSE